MSDSISLLTALSEQQRIQALERFSLLQPFLEQKVPLATIAREHGIPPRTIQHWVTQYRRHGLAGLARRHSEHLLHRSRLGFYFPAPGASGSRCENGLDFFPANSPTRSQQDRTLLLDSEPDVSGRTSRLWAQLTRSIGGYSPPLASSTSSCSDKIY